MSTITNTTKNTTVSGSTGADSIVNYAGGVIINASAGDDYILTNTTPNYTINSTYGYVTIDGGAGNDTIHSNDPHVSINGGAGKDSIYISSSLNTINGGADADIISLASFSAGNIILYGGEGNDTVYGMNAADTISITSGNYVKATANDGADAVISMSSGYMLFKDTALDSLNIRGGVVSGSLVSNSNSYINIVGTSGADSIFNSGEYVSISSAAGNDTINNYGTASYSTVNAGAGNDTINNHATMAVIYGGTGDDTITISNIAKNSTVYGDAGTDFIRNNAALARIFGGDGNDSISNSSLAGDNVLSGDAGNDYILNNANDVSIFGGAGNDTIYASGNPSGVTMNGGAGADMLYGETSGSYGITFQLSNGNDTIYNYKAADTISVASGVVYTRETVGTSVVISMSGGITTVYGAASKNVNIVGGIYVDDSTPSGILVNTTQNTTVKGTAGADIIENRAGGVYVSAGGGNDSISSNVEYDYTINSAWGYVTIDGGAGNDTISNVDPNVSINGGAGDDSIYFSGSKNTIVGGTGNDTIKLGSLGALIQYASGDGNDYISNYSASDTISIAGTTAYNTLTSGDDVIVSVGSGKMTLGGAAGKVLNITGGKYSGSSSGVIENYTTNTTVTGTANADTIENRAGGVYISAGGGNDSIWSSIYKNYTINSAYGYVTIDGGAGNDTIFSNDPNVSISGGAGNDSIGLGTTSSLNVTVNAGSGNDTITSGGSKVIYQYASGDGSDIIYGYTANDTISISGTTAYNTLVSSGNIIVSVGSGGMTLEGAAGKTLNITGGKYSGSGVIENYTKNTVVNGTANADTIENRAGGVYISAAGGNDSIYSSIYERYTINGAWGYVTIDAGAGNDTIYSNDPNVSISGGLGNDSIWLGGTSKQNVTVNAGSGNDTITSGGSKIIYQYSAGDGSDIIYGYTASDTISLASSTTYQTLTSGSDIIVSVGGGGITLDGAAGKTLNIKGGKYDSSTYSITNIKKNTTVIGTFGDNYITNYAGGVYISALSGNDTISNDVQKSYTIDSDYGYVTIDAADGNDVIYNLDPYVSISGGAGNDYIGNASTAKYSTINGGTGNDTLNLGGLGALIQYASGDGNDLIQYFGSEDTLMIAGTTKYDTLPSGDNIIVSIGSARITVEGVASTGMNIKGGIYAKRPYLIDNWTPSITVTGTASADTITNHAGGVMVTAMGGNDRIDNGTNSSYTVNGGFGYVTIDGADGNDTITNSDPYVSIFGGTGNDLITLGAFATSNTIVGNYGNDTISMASHSYGNRIEYYNSNGSDVIYGYTDKDTLVMVTDQFTTLASGNDVIVTVIGTGGGMTLVGAKGKTFNFFTNNNIASTVGHKITVSTANATVTGTQNADTINNQAGGAVINAGKGNDKINSSVHENYTVKNSFGYVTIGGGDGDDTIYSNDPYVSISGGDGNDVISITGSYGSSFVKNNTIFGGTGNDTIYLDADSEKTLLQFTPSDGNDVVYGVNADDTIQLFNGSISSASVSGSDVILTASSGGKITLKNTANQNFNLKIGSAAAKSTLLSNYPTGISVSGATLTASSVFSGSKIDLADYASTVTKVNASAVTRGISIVGTAADNSIKGSSIGWDTIFGGAGNDTVSLEGGVYVYSSGNDLIQDYTPFQSGTISIEEDKISLESAKITGSSLSGSNVILITDKGNITVKDGKGKEITIIDAAGKTTTNVYPISNYPAGLSVSGATLTASTAFTGNLINLNTYPSSVTAVNASALSRGISIVGTSANNIFKGGKGADTIVGGAGNDTVSLGGGVDVYFYQSGADVIQDYTMGIDKINLRGVTSTISGVASNLSGSTISGASVSGSDVILKMATNVLGSSITVKNGKGKRITVVDASGKETSRVYGSYDYDNKHSAVTLASSFTGTLGTNDYDSTVKKIDASKVSSTIRIEGNALANTIIGGSGVETIYGWDGNDSINSGAGNDVLYGGAGNDTLNGGAGNDTLYGGTGNDVFVYSNGGGKDVIADYETSDKITLSSGSISSASLSSSDMIFNVGAGSLTVKNGKGKEISIGSSVYYNNLTYDAKKTAATVGAGQTGTLAANDYASTVKKVDASALTKAIAIVGNAQANTIIGGGGADKIYGGTGADKLYGYAGADTLDGGFGNDTLYGGAGNDVFVYSNGEGNDVIADFTTGDKISVSGSVASASLKSADMVLKIGTGSLTVKNGKGKDIPIGSYIFHDNFVYNAAKTSLILNTGFTGTLNASDYDSKTTIINGSMLTKAVAIEGNSKANSIVGGSGNDTLFGGTGNDTLTGGRGSDTFLYTSGKDVVTDYTEKQDKIQFVQAIKGVSYSGNDVIFAVGSGTLTVKNGNGKAITTLNARGVATTETYLSGRSGSNGLWFTEDDNNFIGAETQLDDISGVTENNYSVGKISATEPENLAQDMGLLSFGAKESSKENSR